MVTYRDGARTRSVGPPASGADYETTDLLDTDPQNPASRLRRRIRHRDVGISNQEGAVNIGRMLLAEANRINWRGKTTVKGEATDSAGIKHPTALMRAGDQIVVEDDEGLWTPQPINNTSHTQKDLTATVHMGAPPNSGEAFFAQLADATDRIAA